MLSYDVTKSVRVVPTFRMNKMPQYFRGILITWGWRKMVHPKPGGPTYQTARCHIQTDLNFNTIMWVLAIALSRMLNVKVAMCLCLAWDLFNCKLGMAANGPMTIGVNLPQWTFVHYLFFVFGAAAPPVGHGLLILEISTSHTTTHHSR